MNPKVLDAFTEKAREALGHSFAESSLLRPTEQEQQQARGILQETIDRENRRRINARQDSLSRPERLWVEQWLFDLFFGFGPLQRYLDDEEVEEVIVNGPHKGFLVMAGGAKHPIDPDFASDEDIRSLLSRVVARAGRRVDDSSPAVDVSLPGRARLHAVLPPLSQHVCLTIRRHRMVAKSLKELVALEMLTQQAADLLGEAVKGGLNILVSGGTASGKTTTLNALGAAIPIGERVVTVEETTELRLEEMLDDCVALESRPANTEGVGQVSIRELVRHALRMRPSRIVVGEVRGPEALDMLSAMNTGHEGSMGTIHANSARQALSKMRTHLLTAEEQLSSEVANEMIAETVDLLVHLQLDRAGKRQLVQICEVAGLEAGRVLTNDLFRLEKGVLSKTAVRPRFADRIAIISPKPAPAAANGRRRVRTRA